LTLALVPPPVVCLVLTREIPYLAYAAFEIATLLDPAHQFEVWENIEQFFLAGLVVYNPALDMMYVEGRQISCEAISG
jgi:hypothetical protein